MEAPGFNSSHNKSGSHKSRTARLVMEFSADIIFQLGDYGHLFQD